MQIKIFTVPIVSGNDQNTELNNFLATHRIIDVQQVYSDEGCWTFCVRYVLGDKPTTTRTLPQGKKVDYKQELSEEEFARFTALRSARKQLAADDAIPAFAVFTDAELAAMSKITELTAAAMLKIDGIGKGRVEHYAEKLLALYSEQIIAKNPSDEALQ